MYIYKEKRMQPTFKIVLGLALFFQTALCAMDVGPGAERPRYQYAVWQHIGGRRTQEDAFCCQLGLTNPVCGVFDGHGVPGVGAQVSQFAADNMPTFFDQACKDGKEVAPALDHALAEIEKRSREPQAGESWTQFDPDAGSTAVVMGINAQDYAYIKNVGDSECMILDRVEDKSRSGYVMRCCTRNHRPYQRDEAERVFKVGGKVEYCDLTTTAWKMRLYKQARNWAELPENFANKPWEYHCAVAGPEQDSSTLAITRALGDSYFKKYGVIAEPESLKPQKIDDNSLVLLMSDGVTDAFTDDEIAQKITHLMRATDIEHYRAFKGPGSLAGNNERLKNVVRVLGDLVLHQRMGDNVTLMLVEKAKNHAGENHDEK